MEIVLLPTQFANATLQDLLNIILILKMPSVKSALSWHITFGCRHVTPSWGGQMLPRRSLTCFAAAVKGAGAPDAPDHQQDHKRTGPKHEVRSGGGPVRIAELLGLVPDPDEMS